MRRLSRKPRPQSCLLAGKKRKHHKTFITRQGVKPDAGIVGLNKHGKLILKDVVKTSTCQPTHRDMLAFPVVMTSDLKLHNMSSAVLQKNPKYVLSHSEYIVPPNPLGKGYPKNIEKGTRHRNGIVSTNQEMVCMCNTYTLKSPRLPTPRLPSGSTPIVCMKEYWCPQFSFHINQRVAASYHSDVDMASLLARSNSQK